MLRRTVILIFTASLINLFVCTIAYSTPRGPLVPLTDNPRECELDDNKLRGQVTLEPDCYYQQRFIIEDPNTTLDCNGAELRDPDGYSINIKRDADNTLVKNCYIKGGKGIAVRVRKIDNGETDDDVRALAPENVVLEHVDREVAQREADEVGLAQVAQPR